VATCPTFPWERVSVCHIGRQLHWKKKKFLHFLIRGSVCHIGRQLYWKKKKFLDLNSYSFAVLGTSDIRRNEIPQKQEE